ncbi:MAG: DUF885 domain-containing protein, partial [Burkholderiales bacterium]|nr:DUF885 domain-containing protein [Burkholderiales bacterium]
MKRVSRWLGWGLLSLLVLAALLAAHTWWAKPLLLDWFYGRVFLQFALQSPEQLSAWRLVPGSLAYYDSQLDDASPAAEARRAALFRDAAHTLRRYDRNALDAEALLSYDTLAFYLDTAVRGDAWRQHDFPLNQSSGLQSGTPDFLVQVHQVGNSDEARSYVERLAKFGTQFDQALQGLEQRRAKGIVPPRFTVQQVLTQMRAFIAVAPKANALYISFKDKLDKLPAEAIDASAREQLLRHAEAQIRDTVYPAYGRLIAHFVALEPLAQGNFGAWHLPDGEAYYAWCVRKHTTTEMTPEALHALGLAEVARIGAQMSAILDAKGLPPGTIG